MHYILIIAFFVFLFFKPAETMKYFVIPGLKYVVAPSIVLFIVTCGVLYVQNKDKDVVAEVEKTASHDYTPEWDKPTTPNYFDQFDPLTHEQVVELEKKLDSKWKQNPHVKCPMLWEDPSVSTNVNCQPPSIVLRNNFNETLSEAKRAECMALSVNGDRIDGEIYDRCTGWDVEIKRFKKD